MRLGAGVRFGPYEIVAPLGAGGMGEVYRARDARLNRDVAVKVLPEAVAADPDRLGRFEREARTLAALNHPNIAAVYAVEDVSAVVEGSSRAGSARSRAIVMELVEGDDLSVRIARGPIAVGEALAIAKQIADALEAAHEREIVHRDLKPANVKVRDDGIVKVLDFGLAKALAPEHGAIDSLNSPTLTARATQLGVILGTAAYMAPEQAKGKAVDKRADIWAFGVVLYEMLTGARPFAGDDATDVLAAVVRADPDWNALPSDTPPLVRRLLQRCLTKDVKHRLHDIADARLEIEETITPRPAGAVETKPAAQMVLPRRRLATALALALGAVVLVAAGAFLQQRIAGGATPVRATRVSFMVPPPKGWVFGLGGGTLLQTSRPALAVSPDGAHVVFRASQAGTGMLYLRSIASAEATPIKGTEGANFPSWSSDGRRIVFCQNSQLTQMPIEGGAAQVLGQCQNPRTPSAWSAAPAGLAAGEYTGPLVLIEPGQQPRDVLPAVYNTDGCFYLSPTWLPDARHFLIVKFNQSAGTGERSCSGVYSGSIDSTELAQVVPGSVESVTLVPGGIVFLRGGELAWQAFDLERRQPVGRPEVIANDVVWFSAGGDTIAYFARSGVKPHRFSTGNRIALYKRGDSPPTFVGEAGTFGDPRISPDERSLLVSDVDADGRSRVSIVDLASGARTPLHAAVNGVWSPDGTHVAFSAAGAGAQLMRLSDRSTRELRGPDGRLASLSDWRGDWLLASPRGLHAYPVAGGGKPVPIATPENGGAGADGALSPDEKWVAFQSRVQIYVAPFPGPGQRRPVSSLAGSTPLWRHDGREIYYAARDASGERAILAVPVTMSGASIAFGQPQTLFRLRLQERNWAFDVTRDGQRFVVISEGEDQATLTVLLGAMPGR